MRGELVGGWVGGGDFWYKFYNIEQSSRKFYKLTRGRVSHSRLSYNYIIIFVTSLSYLSSTSPLKKKKKNQRKSARSASLSLLSHHV
jgi:hypothetical protein